MKLPPAEPAGLSVKMVFKGGEALDESVCKSERGYTMSYAVHVNDTIVYGTQGVCRIDEVSRKNFSGKPVEYYVLTPLDNSRSTIYVPVQNENLVGKMRRVLSAEEVYGIIQKMPEEESEWIENENQRKEKYREILAKGDRLELVRMIKSLYQHQQEQLAKGKKFYVSDERFFHEAEKMLYEEFALVLHIKPEQVLPFILEQISSPAAGEARG